MSKECWGIMSAWFCCGLGFRSFINSLVTQNMYVFLRGRELELVLLLSLLLVVLLDF